MEDIVQETYAELFEVLMKKGIAYIHCPEAFMMQLAKTKVHQYYSEKEYQKAWMFMEDFEAIEPDSAIGTEWEDVLIDKLTVQEIMEYISEKDELTKEIEYEKTSVEEFLDETEWESEEMKEGAKQKMLDMLEMEE